MIRKVFATAEEFKTQNMELGTKLPYAEDVSVLGTELKVGNKIIKPAVHQMHGRFFASIRKTRCPFLFLCAMIKKKRGGSS